MTVSYEQSHVLYQEKIDVLLLIHLSAWCQELLFPPELLPNPRLL